MVQISKMIGKRQSDMYNKQHSLTANSTGAQVRQVERMVLCMK